MARETETKTKTDIERTATRTSAPDDDSGQGPEAKRQASAGSLKEALYGNADAEAQAASEGEEAAAEARKEAAQAELDAQQADRDAGYATSAEEGAAKPKPAVEPDANTPGEQPTSR